jgi:prevent-host-death family protein
MQPITVTEARKNFSDIVNNVGFNDETQIITRNGKQIVAIIPIEELRWADEMEDKMDLEAAEKASKEIETNGVIDWKKVKEICTSWEDIKKELNL